MNTTSSAVSHSATKERKDKEYFVENFAKNKLLNSAS